jgi:hypothetical protein
MKLTFVFLYILTTVTAFAQTNERQSVPGTRISMIPPSGFSLSTNFSGFEYQPAGSSIFVAEIPGPISETTKGFTSSSLKENNMTLLDEKQVDIASGKASIYKMSQPGNGITYFKQVLVFGDERKTVLISGIYPDSSIALEKNIVASILSTTYDETKKEPSPADTRFILDTAGTKFRFAKLIAGTLIYTRDGNFPPDSGDRTAFIASPSYNAVNASDKKQFSVDRLKKLPNGTTNIVKETNEIVVGDLRGIEIIAEGDDATGKKQLVYQVILFVENGGYYILLGTAISDFDSNLAAFKKIAKTFRIKQ